VRRLFLVAGLIGAVTLAAIVVVRRGDNPCDVLTERDLFDSISDVPAETVHRSLVDAVEAAFATAELPRALSDEDLDPVVAGDGNAVHVGVDGYWVMLARVPGGFAVVVPPRPCSILDG
jgi:hypothetical protein